MEETGESIEVKEEVMGVEDVDDENYIKEEEEKLVVGTKEIKDAEARVLRPKTFSETKMANHSAAVYQRFREMVPALLKTLDVFDSNLRSY